jgi:hypothetical protein
MTSVPDSVLPASSKRTYLLPLALSGAICLVGSLTYLGVLVILSPGLYVARWFMLPQFATPKIRIAIVSIISTLVYWPVFFFLLESVRDRKQILRFATPLRLLGVLGIGAAASLIAHKLITLNPTVFGLLSVPSEYAMFFAYSLFGARSMGWFVPLRLISGWFAYSAIAFFVLYKTIGRKSTSSQSKTDTPHP